jgi:hypothetical protein
VVPGSRRLSDCPLHPKVGSVEIKLLCILTRLFTLLFTIKGFKYMTIAFSICSRYVFTDRGMVSESFISNWAI